jgi:hypothetical protein
MKHIRTFESYRVKKNREELIKEAVLQVNDIYKVKTMVDIPQSLINAYVKKVKDSTGNNLRQFFGDVDIAEEIIKYINLNNLDIEKIPASALMGGAQSQAQTQVVSSSEEESTTEETPAAEETPSQGQAQVQVQAQTEKPEEGDFEEPKSEEASTEEKPAESEEKPAEGEEKPAEGEEKPAESEEKPTESEEKPAEGEEKPAEGEELPA